MVGICENKFCKPNKLSPNKLTVFWVFPILYFLVLFAFTLYFYSPLSFCWQGDIYLQKLIFEKPPPNVRKIVLATNMAEASITINDIVFVVDCGKAKETTYDALNNTPCLLPSWISQASARQVSSLLQFFASLQI